jgi:hypothetical protein
MVRGKGGSLPLGRSAYRGGVALRHTSRLRNATGIDLDQPQAAAADGPAYQEHDPAARRRQRRLLRLGVAGAVLTFLTLGLLSAYRTTIYRPADEASHIGYGREVGRGRLPTIDTPIPAGADPTLARILSRRDAAHQTIWTANHPPLFYTLIAVPLRVGDAIGRPHAGVLAARALSVGLAALGLVALAYVVLQLVPDRPQLAVAAAGFIGLMPSLISTSGRAAYNDALAFCTTTVTMAAVVVFLLRGPSALRLAAVAATAGLAALSRASGLLVAVVAGLAVLAGVWRAGDGGVPRRLARACAWATGYGAAVAAMAGWFYLRNLALYGDVTGSAGLQRHFPYAADRDRPLEAVLTNPDIWRAEQVRLWDLTPGGLTRHLWLIQLVPLAGLLLAGAHALTRSGRARRRPLPGRTTAVALCLLLLGLVHLSVIQHLTNGGNLHVRYLFPGLITIGLAAAVGLAALPGGRRGLPAMAVLAVLYAAVPLLVWRYHNARGDTPEEVLLVAVVPVLAVAFVLQVYALWRLRPDPARPAAG